MADRLDSLNQVFSSSSSRRRYEVWFVRLGLADGRGAWWFRYLLMNLGRGACSNESHGLPVQVWATWFPRDGKPQTFIQGFPLSALALSGRKQSPFHLQAANNEIGENFCRGALQVDGHSLAWDLRYHSTFRVVLSSKGWIGFSRTPHSDANFSGNITLDGVTFAGDPLGFGLQGHNCGYRHRKFWAWSHAYFGREGAQASTLEALIYEMPFGLVFRKAVLWHQGKAFVFRTLRDIRRETDPLLWQFRSATKSGDSLEVTISGADASTHRLPYRKTDCRGTFTVVNNSLAHAALRLQRSGAPVETLETSSGAVLEMTA